MTRKGITLTEALVALFIAALGMISLLTLFPLGAMQMGQALKDSRCAQAAQQADGLIRTHFARYENDPMAPSPLNHAMDYGELIPAPGNLPPMPTSGISFPCLIDPLGYSTTWPATANFRLTTGGLPAFPRRTLYVPYTINGTSTRAYKSLFESRNTAAEAVSVATHSFPNELPFNPRSLIERYSVLQDELEYNGELRNGQPHAGSNNVQRGAQYSWAWLIQRPDNARRGLVNLQVLVFYKRTPFFGERSMEFVPKTTNFTPGTTQLSVTYETSEGRPNLLKGRWIMDCTTFITVGQTSTLARHANFYRVVSVNDETPGLLNLELETPIRRNDGGTAPYVGQVMVMKHLAEVFERPPLMIGEAGMPGN